MIKRDDVKAYLDDANRFFSSMHFYLQQRINSIEAGAAGKSKYLSQWLSIIARENVEDVVAKLEKYERKKLDKSERLIGQQKFYKEIIGKTTEHINRAKEFLENVVEDSNATVRFIDVPPHQAINKQAKKKLALCQTLLDKYNDLALQAVSNTPKSWLANALREARAFVEARAASFALPMKVADMPPVPAGNVVLPRIEAMMAPQLQQEALERIKNICKVVNELHFADLKPTKKTRKILGIEEVNDSANGASMHFQYCPKNLEDVISSFGKDILKMAPQDFAALTHEKVTDMLAVDFPTPNRRLS